MGQILEGLRPTDKVIVIEDQNVDHSNDQHYEHFGRLGLDEKKVNNRSRSNVIQAKDFPRYVTTQIEKENELLRQKNIALENNLNAQLAAQQAQINQLIAMMAKQNINTEKDSLPTAKIDTVNTSQDIVLPEWQAENTNSLSDAFVTEENKEDSAKKENARRLLGRSR